MPSTLAKLPWYGQIGVFGLLAGGACGAFYAYYEAPARQRIAGQQAELLQLRADIAKGLETARQLPQFRAEVTELEARLNVLKAVLPEEKDVAGLLRSLQTVATQSNLRIRTFKPSPVVTKQLHAEWPIALEIEGTYHNLALFFDRVGKFARIVNVNGVDVKTAQRLHPESTIVATCVATTFVLLEKPGAAPPPKSAPSPSPAAGKGV